MPVELTQLYQDLDLTDLRVQRPSRFIFFCGGVTSDNRNDPISLRQYLLNERNIWRRLNGRVILAEAANQLYRDTKYDDLISFEEDIARIATLVLVIAESAGSLAELGAFSSNDTIRPSLAIIMQEKYANAESFIRFGPVERIKNADESRVAFFPWRINGKNKVIKVSAKDHVTDIVNFINARVDTIPRTTRFNTGDGISIFVLIHWIVHLSLAIPINKIVQYIHDIGIQITRDDIRDKLYCMKLAGWVDMIHYSNSIYYSCCNDLDPFDRYSFQAGVADRDTIRRKSIVANSLQQELSLPRHVRTVAASMRETHG